MAGRFLLDTNIAIALLDNELKVQQAMSKAEQVFLSPIVAGELYYGSLSSQRQKTNLTRLNSFVESIVSLVCDIDTAAIYGEIKSKLRSKGRPIPDNDLWIAAIALQYGLTLVTRDRHFAEVDGLNVQHW